eukprot:scaffold44691_cov32-Tisochrysis_lutea.AAC.3
MDNLWSNSSLNKNSLTGVYLRHTCMQDKIQAGSSHAQFPVRGADLRPIARNDSCTSRSSSAAFLYRVAKQPATKMYTAPPTSWRELDGETTIGLPAASRVRELQRHRAQKAWAVSQAAVGTVLACRVEESVRKECVGEITER